MTIRQSFCAATEVASRQGLSGPQQFGSRLAWAAAQTLHAQAAEITVTGTGALRVPWGVSDRAVERAEQLQFTAGPGPSTRALSTGQIMRASQAVLNRCWPGFAVPLVERTPFRSLVAVPLDHLAVLSVYFTDPTGCETVDADAAVVVAELIQMALVNDTTLPAAADDSTMWPHPGGRRRLEVSVAVGMLTAALHVGAGDALALLRARAFAGDRCVDDVAADLIDGTCTPHELA